VRVGIAEDSPLFREGLLMQLERLGVHVVVAAASAEEMLSQAAHHPIDAAILDVRLPPTFTDEGLRVAERLAAVQPEVGILLLSQYAEVGFATRLFANGTSGRGYLLKDHVDNAGALRDALHRVCSGESVLDNALVDRLVSHQRHLSKLDRLTDVEQEILGHLAEGRSNHAIHKITNLTEKTIESYITRIYAKLDITGTPDDNRRVLAVLAWLRGA
jgi:DNA-binding NarL/FixJ family response regulator